MSPGNKIGANRGHPYIRMDCECWTSKIRHFRDHARQLNYEKIGVSLILAERAVRGSAKRMREEIRQKWV